MMAVAPKLGRQHAHDVVYDACRTAIEGNGQLADVLAGCRISSRRSAASRPSVGIAILPIISAFAGDGRSRPGRTPAGTKRARLIRQFPSQGIRLHWPLEIAFLLCHASQMSQTAEILTVMDMVTSNGARALRVPDFGVTVGAAADLVVLDARDAREAFATRLPRRFVIRSGKLIAESVLETRRYFEISAMPAR